MKFDVVVGNPPYQEMDGGAQASASPIYQNFVEQAKNIEPKYVSMIIPSRWFSGGKGLNDFRNNMLQENKISRLFDYPISDNCFPGVSIKGGVCYFLLEKDIQNMCEVTTTENGKKSTLKRKLLENTLDKFIRYNEAISIYNKISDEKKLSFSSLVSSRKPFGLPISEKGEKEKKIDSIILYGNKNISYINRNKIDINKEWIGKYKIFITYAYGAGENFPHQIINKPILSDKESVCTETYLVIGPFDRKIEAESAICYLKTKFLRFMVLLLKNTQHATKIVYELVPLQDFTENSDIDWTQSIADIDRQLYKKYNLDETEIAFIEDKVRAME